MKVLVNSSGQVPWDRLVKQLKVNMLLSATCVWHMALENCQAKDIVKFVIRKCQVKYIEKFVKAMNIICYGIVM